MRHNFKSLQEDKKSKLLLIASKAYEKVKDRDFLYLFDKIFD